MLPTDEPHSRFTSRRERWLWLSASLVVAAIALTLVIGPVLAELVRYREVLDAGFVVGLLLVGATVVALALHARARGIELGIVLAGVAICTLVVTRAGLSAAERTHLIEYAILAALIHAALEERGANGRPVPHPAITAIVATTLVGVLDELVQAILPGRVFDPIDIAFNTAAAVTAVSLGVALRWLVARTGWN